MRASINLSLGEEWTDEEIEQATTIGCPACGNRFSPFGTLLVSWDDDEDDDLGADGLLP